MFRTRKCSSDVNPKKPLRDAVVVTSPQPSSPGFSEKHGFFAEKITEGAREKLDELTQRYSALKKNLFYDLSPENIAVNLKAIEDLVSEFEPFENMLFGRQCLARTLYLNACCLFYLYGTNAESMPMEKKFVWYPLMIQSRRYGFPDPMNAYPIMGKFYETCLEFMHPKDVSDKKSPGIRDQLRRKMGMKSSLDIDDRHSLPDLELTAKNLLLHALEITPVREACRYDSPRLTG